MLRYTLFLLFVVNFTPLCAFEDEGFPESPSLQATRLVSDAEHTDFLKHMLKTAKETVMISSYSVSPKRLLEEGIGLDIIDAAARGIKVYIYYENRPFSSQEDYADLATIAECCAIFEPAINHSKCVIKDRSAVAIGSYNWLAASRENSSNASIVSTGRLASGLIADVWQGLRFYQSIKFGNTKGIDSFCKDRDAFSTGEYQFAPGQFLYTLRTPEAHRILLDEVFDKAKTRVLLFSPFMRLEKLQSILTPALLHNLQHRGVRFQLITLPSPCTHTPWEEGKIFSFLNSLCQTYSNFSYKVDPTLHAKTLIADNDLICEGSFNWLSAVSDIGHHANNFEMSVGVRGDIARHMIHSFEQTALGRSVVPIQPAEIAPSHPKRPRDEQSPENVKKRFKGLSTTVSPSFDQLFKIFSGARCGKKGYCARLNGGDYLRDDRRQILYFRTEEEAREAAQALFLKIQTSEATRLDEGSLWSELEETAARHLETPRVASTLPAERSWSSTDSTYGSEDDVSSDSQFLAELDCLDTGSSSQPQSSSQPTFSPMIFGASPSFGSESSSQPQSSSQPTFSPMIFGASPSFGSWYSSDPRLGKVPSSFDRHVKIFSGASFGKKGYCARFNEGDYLRDGRGQILYFETQTIAKQEAYAAWRR
ncbi:MAG: hypothetical protein K2W92_01030 [Alphaproteobacteria bacterium]|nr:hypothetical protein [Alphaproteobacteria bacterium]